MNRWSGIMLLNCAIISQKWSPKVGNNYEKKKNFQIA